MRSPTQPLDLWCCLAPPDPLCLLTQGLLDRDRDVRRGGPWREASMALLARALVSANGVELKKVSTTCFGYLAAMGSHLPWGTVCNRMLPRPPRRQHRTKVDVEFLNAEHLKGVSAGAPHVELVPSVIAAAKEPLKV